MSYPMSAVLHNANLREVVNDIIDIVNGQGGDAIIGNPTIAIGSSNAAKVKNSAFTVVRDGVVSTIAGTETAFTATVDDIADGYGAVYLVYLDESNVIKLLKGTATLLGTDAVCPDVPEGGLKIGEVKVVTAAAIFDASTTELSAGTVTDTYASSTDIIPDISDYSQKHWLHQQNLEVLLTAIFELLKGEGDTRLLSAPTLAIGTSSKAKIKHAAFHIVKDGVFSTITGGEVAFTATTDDVTDGHFKNYNVYLDGTTVKILGGAEDAACPATPAGKLKLGEVKVATAGALFDATTTELDAATVTDTYADKTDVNTSVNLTDYLPKNYRYSLEFKALLEDLEDAMDRTINDRVLSNPTLVIGSSSAAKVKNSAFSVIRSGVISAVGSTETDFTATTDDIAAGYGAVYNIYLDASNVIKILKGTATLLGAGAVAPATPSGGLKIGEVKVVTTALFDATTTLLSAATVTDTYTDKLDVMESVA